jgi:hypothetical protein
MITLNPAEAARVAALRSAKAEEGLYWVASMSGGETWCVLGDFDDTHEAIHHVLDDMESMAEGDVLSLSVERLPKQFVKEIPDE